MQATLKGLANVVTLPRDLSAARIPSGAGRNIDGTTVTHQRKSEGKRMAWDESGRDAEK